MRSGRVSVVSHGVYGMNCVRIFTYRAVVIIWFLHIIGFKDVFIFVFVI